MIREKERYFPATLYCQAGVCNWMRLEPELLAYFHTFKHLFRPGSTRPVYAIVIQNSVIG